MSGHVNRLKRIETDHHGNEDFQDDVDCGGFQGKSDYQSDDFGYVEKSTFNGCADDGVEFANHSGLGSGSVDFENDSGWNGVRRKDVKGKVKKPNLSREC